MKGVVKGGDSLTRIAPATHTDFVESVALRMITHRERKRQCVFHDYRVAADISFSTNAAELMHARIRANICPVFDYNVAGECRGVSHNHLVTDETIVRDMRLSHDEAIIAGFCNPAAACRAAVNSHELADPI